MSDLTHFKKPLDKSQLEASTCDCERKFVPLRVRGLGDVTDRGRRTRRAIRLTEEAFRARIKLAPEEMDMLDTIAAGKPPRNAASILGAIRSKLEWGYSRPKEQVEHTHIGLSDAIAAARKRNAAE